MKPLIILFLLSIFAFSCKPTEKLSKQEVIEQTSKKTTSQNYVIKVHRALPVAGKSVTIGDTYYLKVSKESIEAHLPYFGRTYTTPTSNDEGGIKFVSTDFEYSISEKGNEMQDVIIKTNDNRKRYSLYITIGNTGSVTLNVQDTHRQSISFYGQIE